MNRYLTDEQILSRIDVNDAFARWIVLKLCACQTEPERREKKTIHRNGIGFTAADAPKFSGLAEYALEKGYLSPEQLAYCRERRTNGISRLGRYRSQIKGFLRDEGNDAETNPGGPRSKSEAFPGLAVASTSEKHCVGKGPNFNAN